MEKTSSGRLPIFVKSWEERMKDGSSAILDLAKLGWALLAHGKSKIVGGYALRPQQQTALFMLTEILLHF